MTPTEALTASLCSKMCNMLGLGDMNADQLASKLEETLPVIRSVSEQFKDPVSITLVGVGFVTLCHLTCELSQPGG